MERDEGKRKARQNERVNNLKRNESDKEIGKGSTDETNNDIKKDGENEKLSKSKRSKRIWGVEDVEENEEEKRNQVIVRMRKDEKDEKVKKSLERDRNINDTDYPTIDREIIRSLTPEMANEMKVRGVIFYEDL
ncbi:unnamed protein product, partial [Onchocerca ochengi]|uniref:Uncharacterized protein n=1 Tax=Onchocerca ochengi TaxID=42157 RepID=A0A182EZH1_ONCOC